MGRIGRADYHLIEEYWEDLFKFASDEDPKVRLGFIWAPEIFRVLGKRRAELVRPYITQLQKMSETDSNRVVRIHCLGAIKATNR